MEWTRSTVGDQGVGINPRDLPRAKTTKRFLPPALAPPAEPAHLLPLSAYGLLLPCGSRSMFVAYTRTLLFAESQIRELSKTDEELARERSAQGLRDTGSRRLQLGRRIEDLQRVGLGVKGNIRLKYQKAIDALRELDTLALGKR